MTELNHRIVTVPGRKVTTMYIPSDPDILLSLINTKLRDEFSSLDDLCDSLDVDKEEILNNLKAAGYKYDPAANQFK